MKKLTHPHKLIASILLLLFAILSSAQMALAADESDSKSKIAEADELTERAFEHYDQGRLTEAEPLFQRALVIVEKTLGSDHPDTAAAMDNLAELYQAQGRYAEAEPLSKHALSICEKGLGPEHPDLSAALNNLAQLYYAQGRYAEAEPIFQRDLAICEQARGPNDGSTAAALSNLAQLYFVQGRYAEAEPLFQRDLAIIEQVIGPENPLTFSVLNKLAKLYSNQGRYADAEPLLKRALAINEKVLGPEGQDTATALNNLALIYSDQGRYSEAEPLYQRALAIWEKELGPEHPHIAAALNNLALIYSDQGRYSEAESLYQRALAIWEKELGSPPPDMANSLDNLGALYSAQGRYAEAEPLFQRALAIHEQALGSEHPDTAVSLSNLGVLYYAQGRYAEAEPLLQRALAIHEQALGSEHPDSAAALNNLAQLYYAQGRYAEAEPLFQRALAIHEQALGSEHPDSAVSLANLGVLYYAQGRYAEAEPLFQRALAIREQALGPKHPDTANSLVNLAGLYHEQGCYAKAELLLQRALAVQQELIRGHPDTVTSLQNLALLYFDTNNKRTIEYARRTFDAETAVLAESFSMMSEQQRMEFIEFRGNMPLRIAVSLALAPSSADTEVARVAWLMMLRSKGRVLDAMLEDRQRLAGNPDAEPLYVRLAETKSRLAKLQFRNLAELNADGLTQHRDQLDFLRHEQSELERKLARLSGRFREGRRASTVTAEAVAKALPPDTAMIEFLRITPLIPATTWADPKAPEELPPQYMAFVLTGSEQQPRFIPLGDADAIDDLIATVRDGMQNGENVADVLGELHRLLWAPLVTAVGDRKRVLISPDGNLNFLSFAALHGPDGKYLVDKYDIGYIASARDLVRRFDADGTATNSPALFGDPDFGGGDRAPLAEPKSLTRATTFRSVLSDNDRSAATGLTLARLPASSNEVVQLCRLMDKQNPQTYLEAAATEEHLKTSVRPDILHLATHGFFLPEPDRPDVGRLPGMRMANDLAPRGPVALGNPMHRSGLALAGAQLALDGKASPSDHDDGIVTAEEVGGLDLWGTRLVVLSACQTGLGETLSGEGVMGLRRAFVQAGARNLLLTLWNIEDETTSELMLAFYRDYLETGDAIGAMSRAQRATLAELAANPQKNHPRFWAPYFVSVQGAEAQNGQK